MTAPFGLRAALEHENVEPGQGSYIPNPASARGELARAANAQAGVVADRLELRLRPCAGVEVVQVLPAGQLRFGAQGVALSGGGRVRGRGSGARSHHRKADFAYKPASPYFARPARHRPELAARLVGVEGPVNGRVEQLWTETIIGRSPLCDVVIDNPSISRNHARIQFLDDHFLIVDLGAAAGTRVNGRELQSARLVDGDVIQLGEAVLRFESPALRPAGIVTRSWLKRQGLTRTPTPPPALLPPSLKRRQRDCLECP